MIFLKDTASRINKKVIDERGALLALFVFLFVYLGVTYIYLRANTAPPKWDDTDYLINSEIVFKALQGNDVYSSIYYGVKNVNGFYWFSLFSNLMVGRRAPLIAVLPIPAYFMFGTGSRGLAITFFLLIICFNLVYYKFVLKLTDGWTAFLATAITSTMPLTIGLSRVLFVEYSLMILTVLWVFLQIQSDHFRERRFSIPLGIVLGLGMLMKVSFPVYIIGPVLWGLISAAKDENPKRRLLNLLGHCMIILLTGVVIMSSWYINNIHQVLLYAFDSGFGSTSQIYSLGSVFDINTLLNYWINVINGGISFYYFVVLLFFLMIAGIKHILHKKRQTSQMVNVAVSTRLPIILIWFLVPFIIFSFGVNKDHRFLLPALPALGFIIAQLIMNSFNRRSLSIITILLLLIVPCFSFGFTSLPLSATYTLKIQPFLIVTPNNGFDSRPVSQNWAQYEILTRIKKDAKKNNIKIDFPIGVIPNYEYFNSLNFMYFSVHYDIPYQFEAFGPAKDQAELDAQKERLFRMKYLITKTGTQGPSFAHNPDFTPLLLQGELPFVEVARFNLPDGSDGIIFRKK